MNVNDDGWRLFDERDVKHEKNNVTHARSPARGHV